MQRLAQPPGVSQGEWIRLLRTERGLSLRELARRSKISRTHLTDLEADVHDPRRTTLIKVAEGLDVDCHDLFICPDPEPATAVG